MAYVEVSDIKAFLEIESNADDTIIENLIEASKKVIDEHCGRTFESWGDINEHGHRHTIYRYTPLPQKYGGDILADGLTLMLGDDCCEVHEVINGDNVVIPSTEYITLPANVSPKYAIKLRQSSTYRWTYSIHPEQSVRVEGVFAFSMHAPEDIIQASRLLVKYFYTTRADSSDSDRTIVSGGVTMTPSQIPKSVLSILKPYVRLS